LVINDKSVPLHFENRIELPEKAEKHRGRPRRSG
jgi:hypothetical protein